MASSFEKAFTQAYQAEMARRKDAEAEIAREARAEERAGRERALRVAESIESDERHEARQIERELRLEKRQEEERQRVENEARWLAASRTDPSIAADFTGDWRDDQRKIAAMESMDVRAEKAGIERFDGPQYFQPAGREGGRPVTEATPAYIAGLESAEESQKAQRAATHVREAEAARLGAGKEVKETSAFSRAASEFGIAEATKREGTWADFYEKRDASDKLGQATEASVYAQDRHTATGLLKDLPHSVWEKNKKNWADENGALNRVGTYAILSGFKTRLTPEMGEYGIPTGRMLKGVGWVDDVPPLGVTPVNPGEGVWQGPKNQPPSERGKAATPQGMSSHIEDEDFFSYLDKVRKNRFVQPVEAISGPIPYATKLATDELTDSELWKKYGPSDKMREALTPPWLRPKPPTPPSAKPWSRDYYTR